MWDVIGTAFLVLSHGAWVGAALACYAIGAGLILFFDGSPLRDKAKPNAIGWVATGIFVGVWTIYAVAATWRASRKLDGAIFDDFGFSFLILVVLAVMGMGIWTLVFIADS